jgi:O-antigen polymerase
MLKYVRQFSASQIFDALALLSLAFVFWLGMNYVNLNMGGTGVQLPYNTFAWVGCSVFIMVAILRICWLGELKLHVSSFCYLGVVVLLLLPLAYGDRLFLDVEALRLSGMGAGLAFFVAIQQFVSKSFNIKLIWLLFISTLIQTSWGLLQYYFIFEPSRLFYRADFGIPYGVFQQVNVFAIYLAVGSLLALFLWSRANNKATRSAISLSLLLFFNAHLAVLSGADTAKITGGFAVVCYLAYLWFAKARSKHWVLVFGMALVAGYAAPKSWFDVRPVKGAVAESVAEEGRTSDIQGPADSTALAQAPSQAREVTETNIKPSEPKTSPLAINPVNSMFGTRPTIYSVSMAMFLDEFWTGHGIGTFRKQYLLYQGEYLRKNPDAPAEFNLHHPHNEILYWAIELGVLTVLAFMLLLWSWVKLLRERVMRLDVALIALPLVFQSLLELPFYHSAAHYLAFMLVLGVSGQADTMRTYRVPRLIGVVALPVSGWILFKAWVFLFSTYYALLMFVQFNASNRDGIAYLFSINNPAAFQQRYEFELFQWKLRRAKERGEIDIPELNDFLLWSYSVVQYAPLPAIYESFVSSLIVGGKFDAARKYVAEGLLMYPENERLISMRDKLDAEAIAEKR